jgi:hypothetical protein
LLAAIAMLHPKNSMQSERNINGGLYQLEMHWRISCLHFGCKLLATAFFS